MKLLKNKFKAITYLTAVVVILFGCNNSTREGSVVEIETRTKPSFSDHPGATAFKSYCYTCHNDYTPDENRIAPTMADIQKSYKLAYPDKEVFTASMIAFLQNPSTDKAILKAAVDRFGLMPKLAYSQKDLQLMTDFIHEHNFEKETASTSTNDPMDLNALSPLEKGLHFANTTKAELGKNLLAHIQSDGTAGALSFCNINALPITDSMATHYGVQIKRVTDRPRNPSNQANKEELTIINNWKEDLAQNKEIEPLLIAGAEGSFSFYAPITTNAMCLQCHGNNDQITPETAQKINTHYPNDKAIGYAENALRGIWSITW